MLDRILRFFGFRSFAATMASFERMLADLDGHIAHNDHEITASAAAIARHESAMSAAAAEKKRAQMVRANVKTLIAA